VGGGSNPVVERVLELVRRELEEAYGPSGYYRWGGNAFLHVERGVVVLILVTPLDDDAVLNVRCYLVRDVERPDPELGAFLARLNADQLFGAFSLDEDGDVCYDYSMLGSTVTRESLHLAIRVVADAAAAYATEIISRWGGLTSLEKLRQEVDDAGEGPTN